MSKKPVLNKKVWTQLSSEWGVLTSPDRPSESELGIYEDYIQKISKKTKGKIKALVLGATPETRDLLAKYNADVTIVDINPNMVNGMSQLLEYSNGKEKVVISNWLEIPLKSNSFDVSLCDMGIHHIPFEKWEIFFAEQARLLKKGGHTIQNIITVEENETQEVKDMIGAYKNNIFTREDKQYFHWTCFIGMRDFEGKKYFKNLRELNDKLEKFFEKGVITKKQFEFLKTQWGDFKGYLPPKEVVDSVVAKFFNIKSIRNSTANRALTCYKIYFGETKK